MAGENRKRRIHMYKGERPAINQVEQESTSTNEETSHGRITGSSAATKARESSVNSSTQPRRHNTNRQRKRAPKHEEADVQLTETSSSLAPMAPSCVTEAAECQPTQSAAALLQQDSDGDTFLHIAIVQGNQPLTEFLIRGMQPWGIDIYNNLRQTPLHLAVITRQPYLVKKLGESGADVNMMDRRGQTALHLACLNNDLDCVNAIRDVISSDKLKLELKNFEGFSVLHVAVLKGNKQLITAVLDMGANINDQDSNSGRTALHHAVEAGKCHVAECLMARGADVNKVTFAGNTALHTASGREMDDMAELLLTHGASVNIANREGDTPKVVRTSEQAKRLFSSNPRSNKRRKR